MLGAVAEILRARGSDGWLVGGSVRDRLLGKRSPDMDVVVADDAEQVARQLASAQRVPWFSLSERYPTYRVLGPEGHVDLTSVRGADILADLGERDFTVNAMAVPVSALVAGEESGESASVGLDHGVAESVDLGLLLDPFSGAEHLRQQRLVAVSDRIFIDDALRLMRAARFSHTLGLKPDIDLTGMIEECAQSLATTAMERVVNEMCITLAVGRAADAVRSWDGLGLLRVVLPECAAPGAQVWQSELGALDRLDELLGDPEAWFARDGAYLRERMTGAVDGVVTRPVALRLAGLMLGLTAAEVKVVARRLKLSASLTSLLSVSALCLGRDTGDETGDGPMPRLSGLLPGGAAVSREGVLFMWDAEPWEPEVVMLGCAASAASTGGGKTLGEAACGLMALAVQRVRGELPAAPVDGEMLMRKLGLESGPVLGRALRAARLAWETGEATAVSELVEVARQVVMGR